MRNEKLSKNLSYIVIYNFSESIRNAYANMNQQQQYEYDFDEDDGTILKTVKFIGQDQPLANMAYRSSIGDIPRQSGNF